MIRVTDNDKGQVIVSFDTDSEMDAFIKFRSDKVFYVDFVEKKLYFAKLTDAEVSSWGLQKDGPR